MKITVIKKSNGKVKTMAACPWVLDDHGGAGQELRRRRRWRYGAQGR